MSVGHGIIHNFWRRSSNGDFYIIDCFKEKLHFGENDVATKESISIQNDYSTGLKLSKTDMCNYARWCLLTENKQPDITVFEKIFKGKPGIIYELVPQKINFMHPFVALRTLQKIGLKVLSFYDKEYKRVIKKIFWNPTDFKDRFDTNFLNYIANIVTFVNANPAILNIDMTDPA